MGKAIALLFLLTASAVAQYDGSYSEVFFGRQPSARVEAMGRGSVALFADGFSSFYNPALLSEVGKATVSLSDARPYYLLDKALYVRWGILARSTACGSGNKSFSLRRRPLTRHTRFDR